jgi:hypothetical protein
VPDPPQLYRVTSGFQKIYIESSGYFVAYRSGDDVSFQSEGKGYLVKDLSVRWFYGTEVEKRFSDEVYRRAYANVHEHEAESSLPQSYSAVDELFTLNQARNLANYLASSFDNRKAHHNIEHGDFPFEPDQAGISDVPVGGMRDLWILPEVDGYPLGFNVWGFYDLSRHEKTKGLARN